ncbi:MAG: helix-turn-helix domain-containing protein [Clostridia bacterium]|nr:helix-turn-helix domain-containing protein [Clostridia bacterium]
MDLKVAERIKRLRNELNITQAELAEKLSVSPQAVSRWENGQAYPDIELLVKLADIFKVSVDELMGRESSDLIDLGLKLRSLSQQYYKNGAKDNDILMQLCNILEKLCAVEPIKYAAEYIRLSKELSDRTHYGYHFFKAQDVALAAFPAMDAKVMNRLLETCVVYIDESNLEKWSKHITNDNFLSTWNDVLLERYFINSDVEKHEKARQESIYAHLCQLLARLTAEKPAARTSKEQSFSCITPSVEACRTANVTLNSYSKTPFDVLFLVRFKIESLLTLALFEEGYFDAGLNNLSKLKQYAIKLHQMIEEKAVRRGSVPTLSLVERTTEERDAISVKWFLGHENNTIFDKVRQDESFISAFREMNALFGQDSSSRIDRKIACANALIRAVLKQAFRNLPLDAQKRLTEQYTEGKKEIGLRSIKCTCFPEENNYEKAAVDDFVSYVEVEFSNPKNNLTFEVTVKDGYLRSIISSECEKDLPQFIEKYEIVQNSGSIKLCASDLKFQDESDLCVHGKVSFEIDGDQLSDSREWCVSASAYRFLRTVTENHPYVGNDNQMIPCCGTIMPSDKHEPPLSHGN